MMQLSFGNRTWRENRTSTQFLHKPIVKEQFYLKNVNFILGSTNPQHIHDIFDFKLTDEEMVEIAKVSLISLLGAIRSKLKS